MKVARNPFIHKVEDVPEAIQKEFTELTNDSFAKDEFQSCKLEICKLTNHIIMQLSHHIFQLTTS